MALFETAVMRGLASAKPANSILATGRLYYETDTGNLVRDSGTAWEVVGNFGMVNPMTALDQIVKGGAGGTPTAVNKGANNTVWGVDGSGNLGYKPDPAGGGGGGGQSPYPTFTTPPAAANWAWTNQNGAVFADDSPGVTLKRVGTAANDNSLITRPLAVATPYTVTLGLLITLAHSFDTTRESGAGICLLNNTSGAFVSFGVSQYNGTMTFFYYKWTNATTFSAGYTGAGNTSPSPILAGLLYLRFQDDGTNRIASWSNDGVNFVPLYSHLRTDFVTPDRFGLMVRSNATERNPAAVVKCVSLVEA